MSPKILLFPLLAIWLGGCAEAITKPDITSQMSTGTVLVYREPSIAAGISTLYFGEGKKVYLALENKQFGEVSVAAGPHTFTVAEYNGAHFKVPVDIGPNSTTCFKAHADSSRYATAIVPLLFAISYAFKMEVVACPDQDFLRGYARAP